MKLADNERRFNGRARQGHYVYALKFCGVIKKTAFRKRLAKELGVPNSIHHPTLRRKLRRFFPDSTLFKPERLMDEYGRWNARTKRRMYLAA